MRIGVKGRNFDVSEEVRQKVEKRFGKIGKQVSDLAQIDIELAEERNPSIRESCVAEATLYLKGVTLRAREASDTLVRAINEVEEDLGRQVKRHRDKRRRRREAPPMQPDASSRQTDAQAL